VAAEWQDFLQNYSLILSILMKRMNNTYNFYVYLIEIYIVLF